MIEVRTHLWFSCQSLCGSYSPNFTVCVFIGRNWKPNRVIALPGAGGRDWELRPTPLRLGWESKRRERQHLECRGKIAHGFGSSLIPCIKDWFPQKQRRSFSGLLVPLISSLSDTHAHVPPWSQQGLSCTPFQKGAKHLHSLKAIMMKKNWKERWLGNTGAGWVKQDLVSSCRLWEKKMDSPCQKAFTRVEAYPAEGI